jgi:gas vesicle protein
VLRILNFVIFSVFGGIVLNNGHGMNFLKGMGMGLVAGSVIGMVVAPKKSGNKRTIGRYLRGVGEIIDNVTDAMGI